MSDHDNHIELAAEIVSAMFRTIRFRSELSTLLTISMRDRAGFDGRSSRRRSGQAGVPREVDHSDYIICLEDGRKFKSLKRHLRTQYNLSPEQYREKWLLPADYLWSPPL